MIDPTVWNSIILKITAKQYHFHNRELGITKTTLKLPTLQDVSELIDDLASIACVFRFKLVKLSKPHFILKAKMVGKIMSMGIASFITQIAMVFVIAITNNVLTQYGAASKYGSDIPLAAMGITQKITTIVTNITLGIATGAQPIMGYNYGSDQHDRVKKTYKMSLISSTIILCIAFCVFQFMPEMIVALFGKESELYNDLP